MAPRDFYAEIQHFILAGQPQAALPVAEVWVEQEPDNAKAWLQKGQLLVLMQRTQLAEQVLDKALAIDPSLTTATMTMAAACLAQGNDARAIELLHQGMSDTQLPEAMWLRSAKHLTHAMVRCGQLDDARQVLVAVQARFQSSASGLPDWVADCNWRWAPCWWEVRQTQRVRLRRAKPADAAWLKQNFSDVSFGRAVNRDYARRMKTTELSQFASQLAQQYQTPPADQGAMIWLIERIDKASVNVLGLASFTNIDSQNRRAEFIIGFPGQPPAGGLVLEASALLAEFAFGSCGVAFHKICVSVYADNPRSHDLLSMLTRVGFQQEGILREQVRVDSGNYVDLMLLGGVRSDVLSNVAMQQISIRYLGRTLS